MSEQIIYDEKFKEDAHSFAKEAIKITLAALSSQKEKINKEDLKEKTREVWSKKKIAISGVLQFDPKEGQMVLKPFPDLDGKASLGLLRLAGIQLDNVVFVKPGEFLEGAINLDTGNKVGVVYDEKTDTAFFDHHSPDIKEKTSTAEIIYKTLVGLELIEKNQTLDRVVDFVTKIDNREYPPEEFLKSSKTILGLQRDLDFEKLLLYFKDHESPTEVLTAEELEKYGLKEASERQQKIIDEAMETLARMEKEGKVIDTRYGKIVINVNNELKVGASAAYVKYDGILNITPGKSFALTLKEGSLEDLDLPQGKLIRGKMWIYNEKEPLNLTVEEIIERLK